MAKTLFEWDYSAYPGAKSYPHLFKPIQMRIEMQKAIAQGQGETVMRLYKAE